ncbi:MAG TPA: hypothetical protein VE863_12580 [Pyrinomonadaceae bacterium]|nr:hypothetical protein [Pyrinomonadaceae bacterium]
MKTARVVFLGEVTEIIEPKIGGENLPQIDRAYTIKFKVHKTWKGLPSDATDLAVLWETNCYECPELPQLNETYLIYGNPLPNNKTLSFVGWCNRTVLFLHRSNGNDPHLDMKELDIITKRAK